MDNSNNEELVPEGNFLRHLEGNVSFSENELAEENLSYSDEDSSDLESQESPLTTDSESESSEDVAYEYALKHNSFFETARKRRRRHLHHRKKKIPPSFHFSVTRNTHYWSEYGVEPTLEVPFGRLHGIHTIFTEDEFKTLSPFERRIHVNGQKFKVVSNQSATHTLYRAIAQALGLPRIEDYVLVREAIIDEIIDEWHLFSKEICQYCATWGRQEFDTRRSNPHVVMQYYEGLTGDSKEPPEWELVAAALHFRFNYCITEVTTLQSPVNVMNCTNENVLHHGTVKFHFLRCGAVDDLHYEFLLPIGPLKKIPDGQYPLVLRDVLVVMRSTPRESATLFDMLLDRPTLGPLPVAFALDHRIFLHRSTISHDLWSLLAELLYGKLIHAPQIKNKIVSGKQNFALYYLACKAKKRYQMSGNASIHKLADDFTERFSKEDSRGDVEDLAQAAAYFNFSYTLIGMDIKGNFFWVDRLSKDNNNNNGEADGEKEDSPYLAFFFKTTPNKDTFWFALEDIGRNCPKERKLYSDVQSGDLRHWKGRFYFRYVPGKVQNLMKYYSTSSTKHLLNDSARLFNRASQWTSASIGRLQSSITSVSYQARSMLERILNFLRWMVNRKSVKPESNKVQALFIREQP